MASCGEERTISVPVEELDVLVQRGLLVAEQAGSTLGGAVGRPLLTLHQHSTSLFLPLFLWENSSCVGSPASYSQRIKLRDLWKTRQRTDPPAGEQGTSLTTRCDDHLLSSSLCDAINLFFVDSGNAYSGLGTTRIRPTKHLRSTNNASRAHYFFNYFTAATAPFHIFRPLLTTTWYLSTFLRSFLRLHLSTSLPSLFVLFYLHLRVSVGCLG